MSGERLPGFAAWLPSEPPRSPEDDVYFGIDRSVTPTRFTSPVRLTVAQRVRWWLGFRLFALGHWVLRGLG